MAANLTGLLVIALGVGLWRALSPSNLGRLGAAALIATGTGTFFDGIFRLDCQGIDARCDNTSWHSYAHKIESGFTAGATLTALLILALAFRRIPTWRDSWLPTIVSIPAIFLANVAFSPIGDGAAVRAGTVVVFVTIAFIGLRLMQNASRELTTG